MWWSVCESCSSSAFLLLRSSISCSSRFSCSSARLTSAFSWSLISCHLRAASLNAAYNLSKDLLTVLHCCLCRALLGHTEREASESVHSLSSYCCLTACSPQWASVGLKELQHWILTDWLTEESPNWVSNSSSAASSCSSAQNSPCETL